MEKAINLNKAIVGAAYQARGWSMSNAGEYKLQVLITPDQLVFLVAEAESKKVLMIQPYHFKGVSSTEEWVRVINSVFEQSSLAYNDFAERKIGLFSAAFTLLPSPFFDSSLKRTSLSFHTEIKSSDQVLSDELRAHNMHLLYALPGDLLLKLSSWLPGMEIHHSLTGLLQYLMNNDDYKPNHIYTYIQSNSFQLIYFKDKSLRFCNNFNYSSTEDFIYHLLFACKQLHLDPEKLTLTMMGEIMKDSSLHQLAFKYVRNIEFAGFHKNWKFTDDYALPGHFFFTLFCL